MSIETLEAPLPPATTPKKKKGPSRQPTSSLFRVMWRWHFYAGLIVSPLLMVVALTGGIYIFAADFTDAANRNLLFVEATGELAPYPSLVASAEAAIPGGQATRIVTYADPWRTAEVSVNPPNPSEEDAASPGRNRGTTVYVDPYTAQVQEISQGAKKLEGFFRAVLKIHRQLFIGTTGRILVELATTWSIILFLSGIYLWWPRRKEKVKGVWVPRWSGKAYTVLRDLHSVMGIYLLPVCGIIFVSGLFYTLVWGESFHYVSKPFFAASAVASAEENAGEDPKESESEPYVPPTFTLQQATTKSRSLYPDRDVTVTLPSASADHYEVSAINDYARGTYGAMDSTGFKIHRDSGEVFDVEHLYDNERYWWHTWAYPLHVGTIVGMTSKLIWFAACVILVALPFTGLWMWWKRRPRGQTGFPRKPSTEAVPAWVWISMLLLCFALPTFGLSVLLIIVGEWMVRTIWPNRIPAV